MARLHKYRSWLGRPRAQLVMGTLTGPLGCSPKLWHSRLDFTPAVAAVSQRASRPCPNGSLVLLKCACNPIWAGRAKLLHRQPDSLMWFGASRVVDCNWMNSRAEKERQAGEWEMKINEGIKRREGDGVVLLMGRYEDWARGEKVKLLYLCAAVNCGMWWWLFNWPFGSHTDHELISVHHEAFLGNTHS